jgi:hypothetical protein
LPIVSFVVFPRVIYPDHMHKPGRNGPVCDR